MIIYIK